MADTHKHNITLLCHQTNCGCTHLKEVAVFEAKKPAPGFALGPPSITFTLLCFKAPALLYKLGCLGAGETDGGL